jgi:hypothetical protein
MKLTKRMILKLINLYPAFLGGGIKIRVADDLKSIDAGIKLRFWNRNYVGTQYGGTMFSMCDAPFFLLMVENLGPEYIVWDKSAAIEFKKPGKGDVFARFFISEDIYEGIREELKNTEKTTRDLSVDINDKDGNVIATVTKNVYIRRKNFHRN